MTTLIDEIMKDIAGYLDSENSMEKVKSKLKQHLTTPPTSPAVKDSQPKEVKPIYDAKDPETNRKHIVQDIC